MATVHDVNGTWQLCMRLMGHGNEIPLFFREWGVSKFEPTTPDFKILILDFLYLLLRVVGVEWDGESIFAFSNSNISMNLSLVAMSLIKCLTVCTMVLHTAPASYSVIQRLYKVKWISCMRRKIQNMNLLYLLTCFGRRKGRYKREGNEKYIKWTVGVFTYCVPVERLCNYFRWNEIWAF
jgi:hypothetical protein